MLILATASKAEKKCMEKYIKVIISDVIGENEYGDIEGIDCEDESKVICTREFLPEPMLFSNYSSGFISKKKFMKKYWDYIYDNKEKLASLMMIMIAYRDGKKIALVCDDSEVDYDYLEFLGRIISERYGIEIGTYKDVKNKKTKKNKVKREKLIAADIKRCKKELKEIGNYSEKKKKKHKKDKDKKKDKKHGHKKDKDKKSKKKKKEEKIHFTYYDSQEEANGFDDRIEIVTVKKIFKNK